MVTGEKPEAKDSHLLFLLLFMGEIIVMGKTHYRETKIDDRKNELLEALSLSRKQK